MNENSIFISYSHSNTTIVKEIVNVLIQNGYPCWRDDKLTVASEFTEEIAKNIKECTFFFAFISKEYICSEYCKDEWAYAKQCNKRMVIIKLENTELTDGMNMQAGRFQHISYRETKSFYEGIFDLLGSPEMDSNKCAERSAIAEYRKTVEELMKWFVSLPKRWGTYDTATIKQNANTCEGLLAMKITGLDIAKKEIYIKTLKELLDNVTENGLASKTLASETVVCTAMMLFLVSMEVQNETDYDKTKFSEIAEKLWSKRNEELGWGVYCERTDDIYCCSVNTCWALLALAKYSNVSKTEEYKAFCRQIFELDSDGLFGYFVGGPPKLISTSMYLCLLDVIDKEEKSKILETFNYDNAVEYVYKRFVEENVQMETEFLYGIEQGESGIKKVPWNHITCGAALTALSMAYRSGRLDIKKWEGLLIAVDRIIERQTFSSIPGKRYYMPYEMEPSRLGVFTFPTAYFAWGLQMLHKID